jgi:6-phosphogluconolactonase (cycloisomerase 2 family)
VLYVSNSNLATISAYAVGSGGALQALASSPFLVGHVPSGLALDPSGKFLFVANFGDNTVSAFTIDSAGSPTQVFGSPYTTGTGPNSVTTDPSSKYVYVSNLQGNSLSGFSVNSTTGALTAITSFSDRLRLDRQVPLGRGPEHERDYGVHSQDKRWHSVIEFKFCDAHCIAQLCNYD